MKNTKRSQISIMIIVGVVILVLVGFTIFRISRMKGVDVSKNKEDVNSFSKNTDSFQLHFEQCNSEAIKLANEKYGISEGNSHEYEIFVSNEISVCMDEMLDELELQGYEVEREDPEVDLEIFDKTLLLTTSYPVDIQTENQKFSFDEEEITFPRQSNLHVDEGVIGKKTYLSSSDESMLLEFQKNTYIVDDSGNPVEEVSIRLEDVHFNNLNNNAVAGNIVYQALPHGAKFDIPVEVTIDLSNKDLGNLNPYTLKLAYYDEENDIWVGYPSQYNPETNTVTGYVNHFSHIAIAACVPNNYGASTAVINIPVDTFYEEPFILNGDPNWCDDEQNKDDYWAENKGDGFHIKPEYMVSEEDFNDFCMEKPDYFKERNKDLYLGHPDYVRNPYTVNYDLTEIPPYVPNVYDMNSSYGKDDLCEVMKDNLRDWDEDDIDNSISKVYIKADTGGLDPADIYANYDEFKQECKKECSDYAKTSLSEKHEWFDPQFHVSGDSLIDGSEIACEGQGNEDGTKLEDPQCMPENANNKFIATPMTYGLEEVQELSGIGKYTFYFDTGGDSCIYQWGFTDNQQSTVDKFPEDDEGENYIYLDTDVRYKFPAELYDDDYCSDSCIFTINKVSGIRINPEHFENENEDVSDFLDSKIQYTNPTSDNKLRGGTNTITVEVENTNEDVCMEARGDLVIVGHGLDIREPKDPTLCREDFNSCWTGKDYDFDERCILLGTQASKNSIPYCCVPADSQSENTYRSENSHFVKGTCIEYEHCIEQGYTGDECIEQQEEKVCVVDGKEYEIWETIPKGYDNFVCCVEDENGNPTTRPGMCECEVEGTYRDCLTEDESGRFFDFPGSIVKFDEYLCKSPDEECYLMMHSDYDFECYDSDSGSDIFEYGEVTWSLNEIEETIKDICIDSSKIREAVCSESDRTGTYETLECPENYYCEDGACIREDKCEPGRHCIDITSYEECVDGEWEVTLCDEDEYCEDGYCKDKFCDDGDGYDPRVSGKCTDYLGTYEDTCDCGEDTSCQPVTPDLDTYEDIGYIGEDPRNIVYEYICEDYRCVINQDVCDKACVYGRCI